MPIADFFRSLFGGNANNESPNDGLTNQKLRRNTFRNPIWQTDEDDEEGSDFRFPQFSFHLFMDPLEMSRHVEAQMRSMMSPFFEGFHEFMRPPIEDRSILALPYGEEKSSKDLRSEFLKPGYENELDRFPYPQNRVDQDIDGQIEVGDISKALTTPQIIEPQYFNSKCMSTETVSWPDGTTEKKVTMCDNEGNKETIITRTVGDKVYKTITRRDKNGVETKSENLINMHESELTDFETKWEETRNKWKPTSDPSTSIIDSFPWYKFFGPNPKL